MASPTSSLQPAVLSLAPGRLLSRHPGLVLLALLVVGVATYLPSLRCELLLDDYLHASMIDGTFPAPRSPLDLYDFVDGAERPLMFERGMLPWWSSPDLRIRFLRPLPSALRWAEQRLLGRSPVVPHLHSLLWWVAATLAARRLFRTLVPERPALLATVIFALSPCHALPIAWLANREALISLTLGTLALTSYLQWRRQAGQAGNWRRAAAAAALFGAAMTGGEYALCLGGYVLVFELSAAGERLGRRLGGLLLYGAPAAAYLAVRAVLGYGTQGSGFYNDPLHEPLAFLRMVPRRLVVLLAEQWLTLDAETLQESASPWVLLPLLAGGVALLVVPLRRTYASLDPRVGADVKRMAVGSLLALLPVLAVDPSPRLLGAALLGLAPTLALVLDHAWFPATPPERRGAAELTGLVALAIGFAQLVHGPGTSWLIGERYRRAAREFTANITDLGARLGQRPPGELVILRGWDAAFFMPFALSPDGRPPERWRVLSTTGHVLGLRRDARTLELVAPKDQSMFRWAMRDLFRDVNATVQPGQVFETPGLRATVLEVGPLGPRRVRFEMDRDLDSADLFWVNETSKGGFESTAPPQQGFGKPYEP